MRPANNGEGEHTMKKFFIVPVIVCALCGFLAPGCKEVNEKELFYDATEDPNNIAASCYPEAYTVECSVIFKAGFLRRYAGWDITAIKLFNPAEIETISYTPKIYRAGAGASSPGEVASLNAGPAEIEPQTWETITLDTPVTIEASRDYWAGYSVVTLPGVCLLAQGGGFNFWNSRIAFHGSSNFQISQSNWLVRIVVKRPHDD